MKVTNTNIFGQGYFLGATKVCVLGEAVFPECKHIPSQFNCYEVMRTKEKVAN